MSVFLIFVFTWTWRISRSDSALLRERMQPRDQAEPWDRLFMFCYGILLLMLMVIVAVDGGRFRWSVVPWWAQAVGLVLLAICGAVLWHVSSKNTYLARYARIQDERRHTVVRDGLYGHVRYPMYLGIILLFCGLPLALGSWYSYMPTACIVVGFVYRTGREDRMLRDGLAGYPDYARDVRYRLVPGIW